MKYHFEILKVTRNNVLEAIKGLSLNELNTIPQGFNNNIIWNVAHIVVTQQLLCYKFSGLEMVLDANFIAKYMKGSFPTDDALEEDLNYIVKQLKELSVKIERDYYNKIFEKYNSYTTSYNITLNDIEQAIQFNNIHEGLHFGYIMALKKEIKK